VRNALTVSEGEHVMRKGFGGQSIMYSMGYHTIERFEFMHMEAYTAANATSNYFSSVSGS